ncbi:carboxypeptidase regulatory-like domain-containing protein [Tellurirhabdus bombi]|uniref:carboxypeptidase regulatory-like domain-containing protein n=1 Tax=Tellurirhabdus bombi TaxID=2907205 RepID=UPI001F2142A4|nr:carboxypeptidase regulatory-like domain-containing protein [Tellurirhabdus bombi]
MKSFYYLFLLTAFLGGLWGCNEDFSVEPVNYGSVMGRVLYNTTRTPAANAIVRLSPTGRTVETDSSGNFRFDSVTAGKYTLQTTLEGFSAEFMSVEADPTRVAVATIYLTPDSRQNRPPTAPTLIKPETGADSLPTTVTLKWSATDPTRDSLSYDVQLFRAGSTTPMLSLTGVRADSVVVRDLQYNTTYYWQVFVNDGVNPAVKGETWTFQTRAFPDFQYVYVRRVANRLQLFTSNTTGEQIQLTREGNNWRPIVSPNRQQIAFISNMEGENHIYIMNQDGSNMRRVTTIPIMSVSPATDLSFSWSPDGTQLLYPNNDRLILVNVFSSGSRTYLTAPGGRFFAGCDWTEQGNRVAARTTTTSVYDNEIVVYSPQGSEFNAQTVFNRKPGRTSNPSFRVNGRQLVVSHDTTGFDNGAGRQLGARLYLIDIQSNTQTKIDAKTPNGTNELDPRFSPNGARIYFTNIDNAETGVRKIVAVDVDGANRTELIINGEMPAWR